MNALIPALSFLLWEYDKRDASEVQSSKYSLYSNPWLLVRNAILVTAASRVWARGWETSLTVRPRLGRRIARACTRQEGVNIGYERFLQGPRHAADRRRNGWGRRPRPAGPFHRKQDIWIPVISTGAPALTILPRSG